MSVDLNANVSIVCCLELSGTVLQLQMNSGLVKKKYIYMCIKHLFIAFVNYFKICRIIINLRLDYLYAAFYAFNIKFN